MLQLKNITKDYVVGDGKVHALKGISINFRESEFVSILGPSGCGKTTMLNIIGGLDHYTSGDLIIDEISTKKYGDRDWDTYRNHRIGFIFQSYNLIPHQTVLENVELALNISGIEKQERIKRAKEALDKVGLKGEYNKKPNQLSGGQCQRVAIARALVSDPEILLADEPTGALDTQTSIQIMELIKEISKDRLVIMVTHNPELAEQYSTRIVRLLDGEILSDSAPFDGKDEKPTKTKKVITKKSKLSLWSAFKLSARNLKSKFKRTLLVCIAGSIGITGVASVLSVSTGIQNYIYKMQDDMLSGNPITITEKTIDLNKLSSMQNPMAGANLNKTIENGKINVNYVIDYLIKSHEDITSIQTENNITKEYVDYLYNMPKEYYAAITKEFGIDVTNNLYTNYNFTGQENAKMSLSSALKTYTAMLEKTEYSNLSTLISTLNTTFSQLPDDKEFIMSQYDFLTPENESKFPEKENEIMLVVSDKTELTDIFLASLGYYSQEEFLDILYTSTESKDETPIFDKERFTYSELLNKTFTYYPNDVIFNKADSTSPMATLNPFTYNNVAKEEWEGIDLKITAIVRPKEDLSYGTLQSGFYFTTDLTEKILSDGLNSLIVKHLNDTEKTSFTSLAQKSGQFTMNIGITYPYKFFLENAEGELVEYNETGFVGRLSDASIMSSMMGSIGGFGGSMGGGSGAGTGATEIPKYYTLTLRELGGVDLPNLLKIYPTNFEYKDSVTSYLDKWNEKGDIVVGDKTLTYSDREDITYTDALTLVIGLINNLINVVTTALICFTALSLVVSTVMIAIITYVSVIERIKEIGVIRSLGGRKKDVSHLFNAETFIIGSLSGLIGIGVTYLLSATANAIVHGLIGIDIATLTPLTAIIMVLISVLLTSISGLVPANLAAKKDPVEALRTE